MKENKKNREKKGILANIILYLKSVIIDSDENELLTDSDNRNAILNAKDEPEDIRRELASRLKKVEEQVIQFGKYSTNKTKKAMISAGKVKQSISSRIIQQSEKIIENEQGDDERNIE